MHKFHLGNNFHSADGKHGVGYGTVAYAYMDYRGTMAGYVAMIQYGTLTMVDR